jgi:hypothetical protein
MFNIFKKEIRVIRSNNGIISIYIIKSKEIKNDKLMNVFISIKGILSFHCSLHYSDINSLKNYIKLTETSTTKKIIDIVTESAPLVKVDKFPLYQIVYLLKSRIGSNLTNFYNTIINSQEYHLEKDKELFILEQLEYKRDVFINQFNYVKNNMNNWVFSNGNAKSNYSRMNSLLNLIPTLKDNPDFISEEYEQLHSFTELYNVLTNNKNIVFKKDLEKFIQSNLFMGINDSEGKYIFLNFYLFEMLRTIFDMSDSHKIKSINQLKTQIEYLKKISLNINEAFCLKSVDLRNNITNFCSLFKEEPLDILKKTNICFHLIPDAIIVLNEFYKNNEILSVKREKKLYYYLNNLSKKLSKNSPKEKLLNLNTLYNSSRFNNNSKSFKIQKIEDTKHLFDIGLELSNCAGNFETLDYYKERFNYLITVNNGKKFLGVIKNGVFEQLKGYKNESPSFKLFDEVFSFLCKHQYIKDVTQHTNKINLKDIYEKQCIHTIYID